VALAFPLALLVLDVYPLRRARSPRLLVEKAPLLLLSVAGLALEATRRPFLGFDRFAVGARLTLVAESVLAHASRLLWPLRLTPLDPLPIDPRTDVAVVALGGLVLLGTGLVAWRFRSRAPAAPAVWTAWLLLAFPSLGLAPSGLQATADRYSYVPALALAAGLGAWLALASRRFRLVGAAAVVALAVLTFQQTLWWRDSVALWGRAVELDPNNDLALYFDAGALAADGRSAEAMARYQDVLRLVPDHGPARRDLARLATREADARADAGELDEAVALYEEALKADPASSTARANRAMALFQLGRYDEALPALREAHEDAGAPAAVSGALALLENARGAPDAAAAVLGSALERHPDDLSLIHNLARLLATRPNDFPGRAREAVALAERVVTATKERDPRALDTLALALVAAGERSAALAAFGRAVGQARTAGDDELARAIASHAEAARP
jgi:tetratricopeptide (TPR) repeat protein